MFHGISTTRRRILKSCQVSLKMIIIKELMFLFLFGDVIRLILGDKRVIQISGTLDSAEMSIIYVVPQKH